MDIELFELQILNRDGVALAEREIADLYYAEAEADQEYRVKVSIHKNADNQYPMAAVVVRLFIDGNYLGYYKKVKLENSSPENVKSVVFWGFGVGLSPFTALKAFTFAEPVDALHHSDAKSSTGCIRAEFYEASITMKVVAPPVATKPASEYTQVPLDVAEPQPASLSGPDVAVTKPALQPEPEVSVSSQPVTQPTENNKPAKKPSLRTCPGRIIPCNVPSPPTHTSPTRAGGSDGVSVAPPVARSGELSGPPPSLSTDPAAPCAEVSLPGPPHTTATAVAAASAPQENGMSEVWKRVRTEPDATLEIRCHTADTLDFLEAFHKDRADRIAANKVPVDLTCVPEVVPLPGEMPAPHPDEVGTVVVAQNSEVSDLTDENATTAKPAQAVKIENCESGASSRSVKAIKTTAKRTAKLEIKTEPGTQGAKKAKKNHTVPPSTLPADAGVAAPITTDEGL